MTTLAIFDTEEKSLVYAADVHNWLSDNRMNYSAENWTIPFPDTTGNAWYVKVPPENPPLESLEQAESETIPLPETGELCTVDLFYLYKGDILKCRQTHNRTIYEPKDTPALFSYYRDNSEQLEWIVGEQVEVGWMRIYEGEQYEVIQAHQTQSDWTPPTTPTLWNVYIDWEQGQEWAYPVNYNIGDEVIYLDNVYTCRQAHTSQAGWTPSAVPALWQLI